MAQCNVFFFPLHNGNEHEVRSVKNHGISTCGLNTRKLYTAQARRSLSDTRENTFVEWSSSFLTVLRHLSWEYLYSVILQFIVNWKAFVVVASKDRNKRDKTPVFDAINLIRQRPYKYFFLFWIFGLGNLPWAAMNCLEIEFQHLSYMKINEAISLKSSKVPFRQSVQCFVFAFFLLLLLSTLGVYVCVKTKKRLRMSADMPLILTDFCISVTVSKFLSVGICLQPLHLDLF